MTERIWIKHDGAKPQSVPGDRWVIFKLRDGTTSSARVDELHWLVDPRRTRPSDIMEWFPLKSTVTPRQPSIMELHYQMAHAGPTGVERQVCDLIAARQRAGVAKYGTTVADNPLSLREWLQHALEETLDKAVYLKRAINEIDAKQDDYK